MYVPFMDDAAQQQLEMECIDPKFFVAEQSGVRFYIRDVGRVIGASEGTETPYVYVEHHSSGVVHGRPISKNQARAMGVKI
jgi:hypothetical protein